MTNESKFPSELIDLPSKGMLYEKENPLSNGKVELKYLTAKEEDILTSRNLIQKGVVFDKLLQALIVDKEIKYDTLLLGDKNAIMVAARVLGYGKDYQVSITCPECGKQNETVVDLTKAEDRVVEPPKTVGVNEFEFILPVSKKVITYKILTHGDETAINGELSGIGNEDNDVSKELTTRLKFIIIGVDGVRTQKEIRSFVDNELLARDSRAFREAYAKQNPELDMSFDFKCEKCESRRRMAIPVGIDFFWPTS